jgi:hypothetical protein
MFVKKFRPAFAVAALFLGLASPAHSQTADEAKPGKFQVYKRHDAREEVNPALIGIWKVDTAVSTKTPAGGENIRLRTFQYTSEAKLLVGLINVYADGSQLLANWAVKMDGTPGIEYRTDTASTPFAILSMKKISDLQYDFTTSDSGVVQHTGTYTLSPDGKTLTHTRKWSRGEWKVVYHKWNGLN